MLVVIAMDTTENEVSRYVHETAHLTEIVRQQLIESLGRVVQVDRLTVDGGDLQHSEFTALEL